MVDNKLGSFNNVVNVTKKDLDAFHSSGILRQPISGKDTHMVPCALICPCTQWPYLDGTDYR